MTNKEKCVYNLQQARTSHIRWLNAIKLLISGVQVNEKEMQPVPTESKFGQWFYNEAMLFSQPNCQMSLEEIDELLSKIYDEYTKIYLIYYGNKQGGLKGVLGFKHKVNKNEAVLSSHYYEELLKLSDQLKKKLRTFESQLMSLTEDKFENIATFAQEEAAPEVMQEEKGKDTYLYGGRVQ